MEVKENNEMVYVIGALASDNYYNNDQRIVRVMLPSRGEERYYDFPLLTTGIIPNPMNHVCLVMTNDTILDDPSIYFKVQDKKYNTLPGFIDDETIDNNLAFGFVYLLEKNISCDVTEFNDTQAGLYNSKSVPPNEMKNVRMSLSPSLPYDYTTLRDDYSDSNLYAKENIGVFITDDGVYIKGPASSIFMGEKGTSYMGDSNFTSSKSDYGIQQDHPFVGWVIPSVFTGALTIDKIPNINTIVTIGNTGKRVVAVTQASGKAMQSFSKIV